MEIHEVGEMDEQSEEAGIPVFTIRADSGSHMEFAFLESIEGLTVYHVDSVQYGDFKRMMSGVINQFQNGESTKVTFVNVISEWLPRRKLEDVLVGFERYTWEASEGPHEGDKYEVLVGTWET